MINLVKSILGKLLINLSSISFFLLSFMSLIFVYFNDKLEVQINKPIMIKRHYGESLRSLLGVGEHFEARDKHDFVFCERGITVPHTHNVESRAIIDIQAITALKEYSPSVPVFIDPSHATFKRNYVMAISRAAIAAGADGLLIEVHNNPEKAWVDPLNAIGFKDFKRIFFSMFQNRIIVESTKKLPSIFCIFLIYFL